MDYYTQSDLSLITDRNPVNLMVIGINPGYGGKYHLRDSVIQKTYCSEIMIPKQEYTKI